jgi:hypothetical protein
MTPEQERTLASVLELLDFSDIEDGLKDDIAQATIAGASNALVGGEVDHHVAAHANQAAHDYASERAAELLGDGDQSIVDTIRTKLRGIISSSFEQDTPLDELLFDINESGIFDDSRAEMIARTEVNRAEIGGNLAAYRTMGNVDQVDWVNGEEACEECQGYEDGGPYTLEEAEDLMDETHPNCRCGIVPHLEDDED